MKIIFEIEAYVPNTIYCGNCCRVKEDDDGTAYCGLFHWALVRAKDRPQYLKCEDCLLQVRNQG